MLDSLVRWRSPPTHCARLPRLRPSFGSQALERRLQEQRDQRCFYATSLGLASLAACKTCHFARKQRCWQRRRSLEQPDIPSADPEDLAAGIETIEAQIRNFDSLCSQAAGSSFPPKSNRDGLLALGYLENLADSSEPGCSDVDQDGQDVAALVASVQEDEKTDLASGAAVLVDLLEDLKAANHNLEVPQDMETELDQQADQTIVSTPPSPSNHDFTQNAQSARIPVAAAMSEICRSSLSLGSGEVAMLQAGAPAAESLALHPRALNELLQACHCNSSTIFGDDGIRVSGLVDVAANTQRGDLLLLEFASFEAANDNSLPEVIQEAVTQGVSAIGVMVEPAEYTDKVFSSLRALFEVSSFSDFGLQAVVALSDSSSSLTSLASRLAKQFYSPAKRVTKLIGIVGGEEYDVRTAAWFLFKLLEASKGAARTGLISDRRSMAAFSSKDICHSLTPCIAQELIGHMEGTGVEMCVVEVVPGTKAFDAVEFDFVVDLGETAVELNGGTQRQTWLGAAGAVVCPEGSVAEMPQDPVATYSLEDVSVEAEQDPELSALTKSEIINRLSDLGLEALPKGAAKADLLAMLQECLPPLEERLDNGDLQPLLPGSANCLRGRILPINHMKHVELQLQGMDLECNAKVTLLKETSCAAVAALCAAGQFLRQEDPEANMQQLAAALETVKPPPGTFEVFANESLPDSTIILHEAASPRHVMQALQVLKSSMSQAASPRVTAVFGCDGEVSRGDRAKYGWALASCDKLMLTSASPRGEPPMQILEDVLDAVRQQREWLKLDKALNVFVVADRTDAIKQAALWNTSQAKNGEPLTEVTIVFGSSFADIRDAADHNGEVRTWLCNDHKIIRDSLELAAGLHASSLERKRVPWPVSPLRKSKLPGRSLHWSYAVEVTPDGHVKEQL